MSEIDLHDLADTGTEPEVESTVADDAPEADAVEQHTELRAQGDEHRPDVPAEVDAADLAEQERVVELDEDDYR